MQLAISILTGWPTSSALAAVRKSTGDAMIEPTDGATVLRGELRYEEPMARHVTWRAGGAARRTYFPADLADLQLFLRTLSADEVIYFVGLGSNLLVRDGGLQGTIIFTHRCLPALRLAHMSESSGEIFVEAGVAAPKLARFAALHELIGGEFFAGIPGTVGGALAMNAGCYGGETWNHVLSVRTIDRNGTVRERARKEYRVGYRSVALSRPVQATVQATPDEWFIAALLRFERGDGATSRRLMKEMLERRIASQPLGQPNAGSVFRNPPNDHAARLIEACGLKGRRIGSAMISDKHANFIVNLGGARAADIEGLIELAHRSVREKFGVALEREVRIIGDADQNVKSKG
jgi:UDP-N-acetylmuramate dehydrogenase